MLEAMTCPNLHCYLSQGFLNSTKGGNSNKAQKRSVAAFSLRMDSCLITTDEGLLLPGHIRVW